LPPITHPLACAGYSSHLLYDIRNMLLNPELMEDSIWKMCLHNLEAYKRSPCTPYLRASVQTGGKSCSL